VARRQLVMNKVHRPHIVRPDRRRAIRPERRLDPPLGGLVVQLQAQLPLKPVNPLHVHLPTVPAQDIEHPPVAITDMRLADLLDALLQKGRIGAAGLVMVTGSVERQFPAGPPDRHPQSDSIPSISSRF